MSARINEAYLSAVSQKTRNLTLDAIATHYGISRADALKEVTSQGAESLLDYLVEPERSATAALMKAFGLRGVSA